MPRLPADRVSVSVQHYVDRRFDDHAGQHRAERDALLAAAKGVDDRLRAMNEFRASLSDAQSHYVTRETLDARVDGMRSKLDVISEGAQRAAILTGVAAGTVGVIGGFILGEMLR